MNDIDTILEIPTGERVALAAAVGKLPKKDQRVVLHSLQKLRNKARKAASDARTDNVRRTLVGARVPRDFAAQCKAAAERCGLSMYAWVKRALVVALEWDTVAVPMLQSLAKTGGLSQQNRARVLHLLGLTNRQ